MASPERLDLADWRRRVADLYAAVRAEAAADPARAWEHWREERERLFREHPQSPIPPGGRSSFAARHWSYDPGMRFEAIVEPDADRSVEAITGGFALVLPVSNGGAEELTRIGWVAVPFATGERRLGVYWMAGYAGGLFLPFRDATSGHETYGAGRYLLDGAKSADLGAGLAPGSLILDFNFAFQPSCAFDPRWACPLAPPENRLDIRVEAGERIA